MKIGKFKKKKNRSLLNFKLKRARLSGVVASRLEFRFHGIGRAEVHARNVVVVVAMPRLWSRATPRCLAATFSRELSRNSLTVKSFLGARCSARGDMRDTCLPRMKSRDMPKRKRDASRPAAESTARESCTRPRLFFFSLSLSFVPDVNELETGITGDRNASTDRYSRFAPFWSETYPGSLFPLKSVHANDAFDRGMLEWRFPEIGETGFPRLRGLSVLWAAGARRVRKDSCIGRRLWERLDNYLLHKLYNELSILRKILL